MYICLKGVFLIFIFPRIIQTANLTSPRASNPSNRANTAHCKTNYARTSLFRDYFFNRIAIIWNGIPEEIKVATILCSLKRQLKSFYFKRFYNVFDGDNVRSFKIICPKCRRVNFLKAYSC